jgi:hypothetical protein
MAAKEIGELKKLVRELREEVERLKGVTPYVVLPYYVPPTPVYPMYPTITWRYSDSTTTISVSENR